MAKSSELKVVMVGCGGMARGWAQNALKTPGLQLVGLVDLNRKAAEAMAEANKLPPTVVFDSLGAAIKATGADLVFDVTIPAAHNLVVIEALKAGCHVLGEKPMSDTLDKARKMVQTSQKTGKTYAVTQNYRYNPQIRGLQKFLRSGKIGDVQEVHADFYIGAHFGGFRDEMDYPLILDMSIHTFDAARFISGADPVSVYCHAFNPKRSWYKGDASAVAVFEMSNGIVFSYRGSWCAEGLHTSWNSQWRVVANKGSATWDGADALRAQAIQKGTKPEFFSKMEDVHVELPPMEHVAHAAIMRDFIKAVRTGKTPETVCTDNIKSLAMVLAAVESARSGKKVNVRW